MVENSNFGATPLLSVEKDRSNKSITFITLNEPKSFQEFLYPISNNKMIEKKASSTEKCQVKKIIYVCTFCQVFSPSESAITTHIMFTHETSLPTGTKPEDFVFQLQALQNENVRERKKKGGRPRKKEKPSIAEKKVLAIEPVPGPDGLYWCQKCHRHFKKPRQLSSHVCLEITAENAFSCESGTDSDSTSDFQTYMDIDTTPWLRRSKYNSKSNERKSQTFIPLPSEKALYESDLPKSEDGPEKMKIYWRDDPNYVQLFENDAERYAFEEHLKSIDYSCVDSLFVKVQNKTKSYKKRTKFSNITLYSCIICKKEFHSLFHIRMHCLTHTDAKPFTCPKCPYRSNTKGSLYTHMRNHTGKLFNCSKCAFKTIKRSHLLEHEQTHSSIMQLCKLCKNTYKTLKSLIGHVHKYHNNPGGKKYAKLLSGKSSKNSFMKCNICQKKFKTQTSFSNHTHAIVPTSVTVEPSHENIQNSTSNDVNQDQPPSTSASYVEYTNEMQILKDPLNEIVLNNLLQQKNPDIYQNVFQHYSDSNIQTKLDGGHLSSVMPNTFTVASSSTELSQFDADNQFKTTNTVLEACEKTLGIDLIKECLKDSSFANQVIAETCGQTPKLTNGSDSFGLHEIQMAYPSESIISPNIAKHNNLSHLDSELCVKNDSSEFVSAESKSAETKLFEKCCQTPAYVCCVCSAIYICPATLKVHLKEHINTSNPLDEQDSEDMLHAKLSDAEATIDSVCKMLEDSDNEKELEKLYISSLDMMYYLPEVSVLLENDSKFIDAVLDDFSSFPMSDKYDESEFTSQI